MKTDLERYRDMVARLDKMLTLRAPPTILAHFLLKVMIPRFVKVLGITEQVGMMCGTMLAKGMAIYSGTCTVCMKVPSVADEMCAKCMAEVDQMCAEIGDGDENTPEEGEDIHGVD